MASTYTANRKLEKPAFDDPDWDGPLRNDLDALDAVNAVGDLAVTTHETPSTTLHVDVSAGNYLKLDGTIGTYAGVSNQTIAASSTKLLYLDLTAGGVLTIAAAWPTTAHVRLATVVSGSSTITSIGDERVAFVVLGAACLPLAGGTMVEGANIVLGTTTGTKWGTATTQKQGFFGKTPIVQPTVGAGTAAATYGVNEQGMLQRVYDAIRNLGLGS